MENERLPERRKCPDWSRSASAVSPAAGPWASEATMAVPRAGFGPQKVPLEVFPLVGSGLEKGRDFGLRKAVLRYRRGVVLGWARGAARLGTR